MIDSNMIQTLMETDSTKGYVDMLFCQDSTKWQCALNQLRNAAIGNNKQKSYLINLGVIPRLIQFMMDDNVDVHLMTEAAVVLGSFAKGTDNHINTLLDAGIISVLLRGLSHSNLKFVEACLRCLRTVFSSPAAPYEVLYRDASTIIHLMSILPRSHITEECVTTIVANCCRNSDHQAILCSSGCIQAVVPLLACNVHSVQLPAVKCLTVMCRQNHQVALDIVSTSHKGDHITTLLVRLLSRDKPNEIQMWAAKCLTYLCRAQVVQPSDPIISLKTLPTLVRMCKKDKSVAEKVDGAETLAYLIEVDTDLQQIASITDHSLTNLADYLQHGVALNNNQNNDNVNFETEEQITNELKAAAFLAFASLGANDEEIRKKIIETENMMDHIISGLNSTKVRVQLASVRCLHSLSRSVQQLRTSFQDHTVWKPLMKLITNAPDEVLIVASSTLCNLLLEFSPSKEPILEQGAIDMLVDLTKRESASLRLNGIWALMNMAFQADQKIKAQILSALGTDQLFRLLSDANVDILMKTLGLLRNLLSNKPHIDHIMTKHGKQIMQAVILILEGDHQVEIKEQTLCILANVADGESAKDFIMGNEDVLKKLMTYMVHANVKLQTAATFCISNLIWNEEEGECVYSLSPIKGALDRQAKLREMGVQKILQQLLSTNDTTLFDKVKTALQQFT